jgi:hypothetical protein
VVPDSGILIQTPRNEAPALLQVNHVALELSGTIFLQAQPERVFIVNVLEGDVQLALLGNTQTARAGTQVMIPLDDTLMPLEEPGEPQRYDYDRLTVLPLSLLPRITTVAVSLDDVLLPPPPDGSDPLASLGPESVCTVAAISAVNLRNGPGLRFPVIGEMMAGQSAHPDGLWSIPGTAPWWRLTPGVWVSWQAVFFEGNCNSVSRIEFTAAPAG